MIKINFSETDKEIIKYIREHKEATSDEIPLDMSIRKKSGALKKLAGRGVLNKTRRKRTWVYSIAWIHKEGFDFE